MRKNSSQILESEAKSSCLLEITMDLENGLQTWIDELRQIHLPRWDELPVLDLYMDQVVTLIERYLGALVSEENEKMLTKSMVNNYVKLQLIPPPVKRQYSRRHLAFLIVITLLKQIMPIKEVKDAILLQAKYSGEKEAYNYYIEEQEKAIHGLVSCLTREEIVELDFKELDENYFALKMATMAFAAKIAATKLIDSKGN